MMAYAQWVVIILKNRSNQSIKIKNVKLGWGKFYADSKPLILHCRVTNLLN